MSFALSPRTTMEVNGFMNRVITSFDKHGSNKPQLVEVKDFLFDKNRPNCALTTNQRAALKNYKRLYPDAIVVDVNQNPLKRPRWGKTTFPTLTTNSAKLVHIPSELIFSRAPSSLVCMGSCVSQAQVC